MPRSIRRPVGVTGAHRSHTREIPLPGMCWPNMVMMADSESRPAMSVMPLASIRRPAIGSNFRTLNAESPTRTADMKLPTRRARRGQPEPSQDHHRAEDVAEVHSLEGGLRLVQLDLLGDERVEVEPALPVEVDRIGKSLEGRQSPYQDDFSAPPRLKTSTSGRSGTFISGVGTPTRTTCQPVAGVEHLFQVCGRPTAPPTTSPPSHPRGSARRSSSLAAAGSSADERRVRRPVLFADTSFFASMSTAMIGEAPAGAEPRSRRPDTTAADHRPDFPQVTAPVLIAAPRPAMAPQPSRPPHRGSRPRTDCRDSMAAAAQNRQGMVQVTGLLRAHGMHHQVERVCAQRGGPGVLRHRPDVVAEDAACPDTDQRSQGIARTEHQGSLDDPSPRRLRRPQSDGRLEVVQASTNAIGIRAKSEFMLPPPARQRPVPGSAAGSVRQAAASGRWPPPPPPRPARGRRRGGRPGRCGRRRR